MLAALTGIPSRLNHYDTLTEAAERFTAFDMLTSRREISL